MAFCVSLDYSQVHINSRKSIHFSLLPGLCEYCDSAKNMARLFSIFLEGKSLKFHEKQKSYPQTFHFYTLINLEIRRFQKCNYFRANNRWFCVTSGGKERKWGFAVGEGKKENFQREKHFIHVGIVGSCVVYICTAHFYRFFSSPLFLHSLEDDVDG